ncbi:glycosyltransferase family 10 domain-containing protein [Piscinibacter sp. HJYY11]|uniref:glycosyltransferase family 10 domain-containing protein n=1 Tax=Piscinibacter sp. HJYY11 TaxID=2801333 RepID=UPI00191EC3CA|nr:glycosyltransferase family 10 [Piscinibacter sp. HJYY11]MBL0727593.1 hypothetical protein [Piscinibacter sp. HJYY11]
MSPLSYLLKKHYYRHQDKRQAQVRQVEEEQFRQQYFAMFSPAGKTKVCTYQTGFSRHYTRFFTSSDAQEHSFFLVEDPAEASVVVFINTIDDSVLRPDQRAILFFHEPLDYAHLYQSKINEARCEKSNLEVVSHLPSPSLFIKNPEGIAFHRSIPYVHFHHMATPEQLKSIDGGPRTRQICSMTSGLNGIPGYQKRAHFIKLFSEANKGFDLFGRFSKQAAGIRAYRGPSKIKWKTISEYKYNLVIENSRDDFYISEKIFDALICGCMPIYHGSDKIFEILPKEWFYYLPTLEASEIDRLNAFVATDAYKVVAENRASIARYIHEHFSFYGALEKLLAREPLVLPSPESMHPTHLGEARR